MNTYKQIFYIIAISMFLSGVRYLFMEEEYALIKPSNRADDSVFVDNDELKSLTDYLNNLSKPEIIDMEIAKKIHENNLAVFIDARDPDSFGEKHIKGAVNITFESLEEFYDVMDIEYLLEIEKEYFGHIKLEQAGEEKWIQIGLSEELSYMMVVETEDFFKEIEKRHTIFVVYCSGEGCSLSEELAFYMHDTLKINKILIYEGGVSEWDKNNLPIK